MRNLEATSCLVLPADSLLSEACCFCLDCDSGSVWVATGSALCCITTDCQVSAVVLLVEGGHMTQEDGVCSVDYISDLESVCLALEGGDLLLCNVHTHQVECMGSVGAGVCCMAWSPDQELVVLVSGQGKLLMMTRDFDPISETSLHPEEFGEAKPVTVGWGKKATQFHGSLGKPTAEKLKVEPLGPALPWDDGRPRVSWRGDGEFFACSTVDPTTGSRRLRVWTRDCQLHSTSEAVEGVEQVLHWRPCGNVLACSQRKSHQHDIIFLERNGLWRGHFTLPFDPLAVQVLEVQWNSDSAVLALWLQDLNQGVHSAHAGSSTPEAGVGGAGGQSPRTFIQLWCAGNYHWYLKQELYLTPLPGHTHQMALAGMLWDPIVPLRLHLLTQAGQYMCYNWRWGVAESKTHSQDNMASVAVIDGARLLLTPFRYTVIPPPLCAHELSLPSPVLQVTFAPAPLCNDFVALLASGQLAVFSGPKFKREGRDSPGVQGATDPPQLLGMARPAMDSAVVGLHSLRQLCWWRPDRLLGVVWDIQRKSDVIVELSMQLDPKAHTAEFVQCHSTLCPQALLCLCCNPDSGTVAIQLVDGSVFSYSPGLLQPWGGTGLRFPDQPCEQIALAVFGGKECVVGLTSFQRVLYLDTERLATGCTSFAVHNEFLLLSSDSHILRCISLHTHPTELATLAAVTPRTLDESVRRVERGSRIVTAISHDIKVILQMPRGNLETVCPRALVLCSIRRNLDQRAFRQAFETMRKHRINLNLIHDHNPLVFLSHVKEFVEQLESVNYINLFLTDLREEDVTETMYPGRSLKHEGRDGGGSKVDCVCDAVRQALMELGESKYLLSIITAHVKKTHPELEAVLEKVKYLKEHPPLSTPHAVTAEEALRYSLFLVDVNELFDVALGTYDFSLVLMVAEKSQKDPKEYLPFLNELRQLPVTYQRYRIDKFLRRYSRALQHISQCPDKFEECLQLVCEHTLYAEGLNIFTDRASEQHKAIARAYAEYLTESGKHREAGIILTQCGCLQEALEAHKKASEWRHVFSLSAQLQHSTAERVALARRLAGSLKTQTSHSAAATVLLDYAHDVEEAEVALLEGGLWEEAERIAYLHGRADLIETHLRPGLLEAHMMLPAQQAQLSLSETLQSSFTRHVSRLAVVRKERQRKCEAMLEGTYAADEKEADLFSETSSMTGRSVISSTHSSVTSKASGRSSKNRRKAERKKHSLREGSTFEDMALMDAIEEIVGTVDKMQDEVRSLLGMLVQHGFSREAARLQTRFGVLVDCVRQEAISVWQSQLTPSDAHTPQEIAGPGSTVNSIIAAMAASQSSYEAKEASTIATFRPPPKLRDTVRWKLDYLSCK